MEEAEKKIREEQERIYKQLSEGNTRPGLLPAGSTNTALIQRQSRFYILAWLPFPQTLYVLCFLSLQQTRTLSSNEPDPDQSPNVPNIKQ